MVAERIVPLTSRLLSRQMGRFKELMGQLDSPNVERELDYARASEKSLKALEQGRNKPGQPIQLYYGLLKQNELIGLYRIFVNPKGTTIWTKTDRGLKLQSLGPYVDSGRMVVYPQHQKKGYSSRMRIHALNEIRRLREKNPEAFPDQYLVVPTGAHRQEISGIYAQHGRRTVIPKKELEEQGVWDQLDRSRPESQAIFSHVKRLGLTHLGYVKSNLGMAFTGNLDDVLKRVPTDVRLLKKESTPKGRNASIKRIALVPGSFDPITTMGHSRVAFSQLDDATIDKVLLMPSADYRTGAKIMNAPAQHRLEMARQYVKSLGLPKLELWEKDFQFIRGQAMRRRPLPQHLSWLAAEYPKSEIVLTVGSHTLTRERGFLNELARDRSWEHLPISLSFQVAFRGAQESLEDRKRDVQAHYEAFLKKLSPKQRAKIAGIVFSKIQAIEESSTHIRRLIAGGELFEHLVPDQVADYIKKHRLYGYEAK